MAFAPMVKTKAKDSKENVFIVNGILRRDNRGVNSSKIEGLGFPQRSKAQLLENREASWLAEDTSPPFD